MSESPDQASKELRQASSIAGNLAEILIALKVD